MVQDIDSSSKMQCWPTGFRNFYLFFTKITDCWLADWL